MAAKKGDEQYVHIDIPKMEVSLGTFFKGVKIEGGKVTVDIDQHCRPLISMKNNFIFKERARLEKAAGRVNKEKEALESMRAEKEASDRKVAELEAKLRQTRKRSGESTSGNGDGGSSKKERKKKEKKVKALEEDSSVMDEQMEENE